MVALRILLKTVFLVPAFSILSQARAGDWGEHFWLSDAPDLPRNRAEFSNGVDVTASAWSAYASAIIGLTGPLDRDGWRLKLFGAYARYSYDTRDSTICQKIHDVGHTDPSPVLDQICDSIANNPPQGADRDQIVAALKPYGLALEGDHIAAVIPHQATRTQLAVAPGYQARFGTLIVKSYLGLGFEQQQVTPEDPSNPLTGRAWGAQGWVEAWLPLGERFWMSADGCYFTGTSRYSADMKFAYVAADWLAFGPELAAFGDTEDTAGRAGAFLRVNAGGMETTLAGGLSGAYRADPGAYGSASLYLKF
jgi:Cellulose biosynthesis protein BcsS